MEFKEFEYKMKTNKNYITLLNEWEILSNEAKDNLLTSLINDLWEN